MITEEIYKKIKQIPESPGIYQMLDANRRIIYIGKSKCLKKRVGSYFVSEPRWEKAKKMAQFIHDIDYIVTDTHLDAMLLECEKIKKIRPFFNVLMKYDQKYIYLVLEKDARKNPLKTSYEKTDGTIGLFRSRRHLDELIQGMLPLYPLKKQVDGSLRFDYHRVPQQLKSKDFEMNQDVLKEIFQSTTSMEAFIVDLEGAMRQAAERMEYEYAIRYRDLADLFRYLKRWLDHYQRFMDQDILYTVPLSEGYKLYYIRNGLVIQSKRVKKPFKGQKEQFLWEVGNLPRNQDLPYTEKEQVDYRFIVYAELTAADENAITYISKKRSQNE